MSVIKTDTVLSQLQNETSKANYLNGRKNLGSDTIGKDGFLQLLMTQLKNQDPLNPTDNKEFIAQQAQFTQIEKLDNLNAAISRSNFLLEASSLVGKEVQYKTGSQGETARGMVDSVLVGTNGTALKVADKTILSSDVVQVYKQATNN
ncbi:MAG: flagellar hook capping FlgD N-terminal domain-containing protein [Vampirovibrionales bacterium]|nr:flagellar hook capping FlgD N-terminal domain-containing protein [Vampirovibrionales bacterium]